MCRKKFDGRLIPSPAFFVPVRVSMIVSFDYRPPMSTKYFSQVNGRQPLYAGRRIKGAGITCTYLAAFSRADFVNSNETDFSVIYNRILLISIRGSINRLSNPQ